jgi:hexosaminidase
VRARGWVAFAAIAVVAAGTITGWMLMRDDDDKAQPLAGVVPAPVQVTPGQGQFTPSGGTTVTGEDGGAVADYLISVLPSLGPVVLMIADGHGDEGYELDVTSDRITLTASHPAGLFHGVQTLRQLVTATGTIPVQRIVDQPRFAYRGVMLDVARHFFGVADVKRVIDLAALLKLNHLHLHLTDDQGWRIAVSTWPRLTTYGAGTEVGGGPGGFYTQDDYREIVTYAQDRFITVVPEVDLPGHTNAALASYPELTCDGKTPARYTGIEVGFSSLCADNEVTYKFLDDVFGELAKLTPGPYLHLGGDEAKTTGPDDYAAIVERAEQIVRAYGKTAIGWHEIADADLDPSTVVQFWGVSGDAPDVAAAAARGNRIVLSPANRAYLDMKYDQDTPLGLSWAGYVPVPDAYDWDPGHHLSGVDEAAVLGIEAPLWTETVRTLDEIEYLAMPRLAVLAELGWAPADRHDWSDLRGRLAAQEPLWTLLGINFYRAPEIPWL